MRLPHSVIVVDWGLPANGKPFTASDGDNPPPLDGADLTPTGGIDALKAAFKQYQVACLVTFEGFEDVSSSRSPLDVGGVRREFDLVRNRSVFDMVLRKDTYQALRLAMKASRDAAVATGEWTIKAVRSGNIGNGTFTSDVPFMSELGIFEDPMADLNPFTRPVTGKARQIAAYGLDGRASPFWGRGVEIAAYYDRGQTVQLKLMQEYDRL